MDGKEARERALTEWSISRAYSVFLDSKAGSFAIITSWRANDEEGHPVAHQVNDIAFSQLKSEVEGVALGLVEIVGHELGRGAADVTEPSLWINGISLSSAQSLSDRFNQWGFIFAGPETDGNLTLISKEGHSVKGKFSPARPLTADEINRYWSEWRRRPFRFVEMKHPVQNSVEGQVFQAQIADRVKVLVEEHADRKSNRTRGAGA